MVTDASICLTCLPLWSLMHLSVHGTINTHVWHHPKYHRMAIGTAHPSSRRSIQSKATTPSSAPPDALDHMVYLSTRSKVPGSHGPCHPAVSVCVHPATCARCLSVRLSVYNHPAPCACWHGEASRCVDSGALSGGPEERRLRGLPGRAEGSAAAAGARCAASCCVAQDPMYGCQIWTKCPIMHAK
jgi:hypothetical protein